MSKSNAAKVNNYTLAKIFEAHRWLWLSDSYERYERNAEELRNGGQNYFGDPEEQNARKFLPLLFLVLSHDDIDVEHQWQLDRYLQRLADIENTYNVLNRSLDFEVKLGNSLKQVLAKPRSATAKRNLLSDEQFKHVASILFSVRNWGEETYSADGATSFWQTIYDAQREINENGSISATNRRDLEKLNRVKTNRDRRYSRLVLFVLLAEFFDDFSAPDYETNISEAHVFEDYDPKTFKKIRSARTYFDSPFARFVSAFYVLAKVRIDFEPSQERLTAIKNDAWIAASRKSCSPGSVYAREVEERTDLWCADAWHEKFGFERGVLKRRSRSSRLRITEKVVTGCSARDLALILSKLETLKSPK